MWHTVRSSASERTYDGLRLLTKGIQAGDAITMYDIKCLNQVTTFEHVLSGSSWSHLPSINDLCGAVGSANDHDGPAT